MRAKISHRLHCLLFLAIAGLGVSGCGAHDQEVAVSRTLGETTPSPQSAGRRYDQITETGLKLMDASLLWLREQELPANARSYAQPAQCARNISKVFQLAGLGHYSSPLVPELVAQIRRKGGLVVPLPRSSEASAQVLATKFRGHVPAGTLVAGCLRANCSGQAGDGHIAMVGDLTESGALKAYHNNWYRPDNEGGVWKEHMIPLDWYNRGYRRKYMPTPWITIVRAGASDTEPVDIRVEVPAIDDLDPTNYFVTLAVPVEVTVEAGL